MTYVRPLARTHDRQAASERLRDKISKARAAGVGEEISRPDFLRLIGVPDCSQFTALVKALERFEKGGGELPLFLRTRATEYFERELPYGDLMEHCFSGDALSYCRSMHAHARTFYMVQDDRADEIAWQIDGRFFTYSRQSGTLHEQTVVRSYAKIRRPTPSEKFVMAIEYQRDVVASSSVGARVDHDFFVGICEKKDDILFLLMRQCDRGTPKTIFLDSLRADVNTGLVDSAFGVCVEACGKLRPSRTAYSPYALQRIPESMGDDEVDSLIGNFPAEAVDAVFSNFIFGAHGKAGLEVSGQ